MGSQNDSPADRPTDRPTDVGVMSHDRTLDIGTLGFWKVLHLKMHLWLPPFFFPLPEKVHPNVNVPMSNVYLFYFISFCTWLEIHNPRATRRNRSGSAGGGDRPTRGVRWGCGFDATRT